MLASPGRKPGEAAEGVVQRLVAQTGWWFEVKWDGIRAVVDVGEQVRITNRRGADITSRYPDLVAGLAGKAVGVLDCEIVVLDKGVPSFERAHLRDAQSTPAAAKRMAKAHPATLVPFDVLVLDGVTLELLPYTERRVHLERVLAALSAAGAPVMVPPTSDDGMAMWAAVREHHLEGLIAKKATSRYRRRRSPDWIKIKATSVASVMVGGFTPGTGHLSGTFGNLHMMVVDHNGDLVRLGNVGSGFTDKQRREIKHLLNTQQHPIIIDVEYLERSSNGQLRMPVFRGLRTDVEPLACNLDQF
jgi:bifunctional non-homologous end joining protein LigD